MKTVKIQLSTIDDVKAFVSKANKANFELDVVSGKYVVDAKSIMGMFSLDLSKSLELTLHSTQCKDFLEEITEFVVEN